MRILDRFLIKSFLISLLYCLFLFFFLYVIIDLFGHLDEILRENVKVLILFKYYIGLAPLIIVQTSPVASLISIIYILNSLNKEGVIVAMGSAGINIWRVISPFIIIGILLGVIIFLIDETVLPIQMSRTQDLKEAHLEKKKNLEGQLNNITFFGSRNRLFFIGEYNLKSKSLKDITILEQNDKRMVVSKITARSAQWQNQGWTFKDVLLYNLDSKGEIIGEPIFFNEKVLDIAERPKDISSQNARWEFTSSKELYRLLNRFSKSPERIVKNIKIELYNKFSLPFNSLVLILIGAAFSLKPRRGGILLGIGISLLIGFVYYIVSAISIAFGKAGVLPPFISGFLANLLFGGLGILTIAKSQ